MRAKLYYLLLVMCLSVLACASTTPTPTGPQTKHPEIFATSDFKIHRGKWFHTKDFEQAVAKQKASLNAPAHVMELFDSMLPKTKPMEMQMKSESMRHQSAFISLGFYVNKGTDIIFQAGGLLITLKGPNGQIVETRDKGCLFARTADMRVIGYDSARGTVIFNRDFNNKPDYKIKPNIVWVRLEPQYLDWELLTLTIDDRKIHTQSPAAVMAP